MNKETCIVLGLAVAAAVAVAIFLYANKGSHVTSSDQEVVVQDESADDLVADFESADSDNLKDRSFKVDLRPFEEAKYMTVERVIRTTEIDSEGNIDTSYQSYVLSDINLGSNEEHTEDFSNCFEDDELDESQIVETKFSKVFGFSYEGMNGAELLNKILDLDGLDGDFSKVSYDENAYEQTKEKVFYLEGDCDAFDVLLPLDFDGKVLDKKLSCQTREEDGAQIPDYYLALVRYKDGDKTVEKSIYLQITINDWEVDA